MITPEKTKQYFWYFVGIMGVVFFWTGVWDGIGSLPYLRHPFISLIIGAAMLLAGGLVKGYDNVKKAEENIHAVLHTVYHHPQKREFHIKYHDKVKKKDVIFPAHMLKKIEKGVLVLTEKGRQEIFVPIHRVTEVLRKGKTFQKLSS